MLHCSYEDATALVTISEGRHYSLGLDLTLVMGMNAQELIQFLTDLQQLYCRLLTFPLVTVAAANGEGIGT